MKMFLCSFFFFICCLVVKHLGGAGFSSPASHTHTHTHTHTGSSVAKTGSSVSPSPKSWNDTKMKILCFEFFGLKTWWELNLWLSAYSSVNRTTDMLCCSSQVPDHWGTDLHPLHLHLLCHDRHSDAPEKAGLGSRQQRLLHALQVHVTSAAQWESKPLSHFRW